MVKEGERAPDFSLADADGSTVRLSDFRGSVVVLYFYPRDDTPGCTKEACSFRDTHDAILARKAVVLGVSADTVQSHGKFRDKYGLPFTLLADPERAAIEAYGVWVEKKMYGKTVHGVQRSTFVIGPDGVVLRVFPKVNPEGHAEEVLASLA
ncbi:MAG TPA: thioredoxin-dependent thiol peroxidase [Spirochaetales bacterium]|nr:thioredoxin-dependent thiol peroxidase [Spirochaetales bacterium]